jgi:hypothetical protein
MEEHRSTYTLFCGYMGTLTTAEYNEYMLFLYKAPEYLEYKKAEEASFAARYYESRDGDTATKAKCLVETSHALFMVVQKWYVNTITPRITGNNNNAVTGFNYNSRTI